MFQVNQLVFYMCDNRVHSAPIVARLCVDADEAASNLHRFGKTRIEYATCHGIFLDEQVFGTKEELLASL